MKQDIDYPHAKRIFDLLEKVVINSVPLHLYFVVDGYDYWQFYRQRVFEETKEFTRTLTSVPETPKSISVCVKDSAVYTCMFLFGLCAYTIAYMCRKRVLIYGMANRQLLSNWVVS